MRRGATESQRQPGCLLLKGETQAEKSLQDPATAFCRGQATGTAETSAGRAGRGRDGLVLKAGSHGAQSCNDAAQLSRPTGCTRVALSNSGRW